MKSNKINPLLLLIFTLLSVFFISFGQSKSPKRGICGDASVQDLAVLSPAINWYYDWGVAPPTAVQGQLSGIEWVPMCWGGVTSQNVATIEAQIPAGAKYLLGFNEPNFKSQANLTPAQAAAMWPNLEKIAAEKGLKLVSPAVNWCGDCVDGVTYDPTDWLDKFIAACPSCNFDYIAIHNYSPSSGALSSYIDKFRKYNKPLWITEFAPWDPPKPDYAGVVQYMKEAIPILENEPIVFRYSWFATRVNINPDIDLLASNGTLTKLGQLYCSMGFEGLNTDIAPIAMAGSDLNINLPSTSVTLNGFTYDANGDNQTITWTQVSGPSTASFINNANDKPTVSDLVIGTYIFKITVTANGKTDTDEVTVKVGTTDVGRNKPITASSVENTGTPAINANDGNLTSRWSSAFSDPQWIQIDLQETYNLTGVSISWEAAAANKYEIQVSDNATAWNSVFTNTNGDGGIDNITFSATARYVRMYSTSRTTIYGNSIYEFQVFGTPVTGVEKLEEKTFSVSPNPVTEGIVKIIFAGNWTNNDAVLSITSMSGKILYSKLLQLPNDREKVITLQTKEFLKPGLYILSVKGNNVLKQTKLVIK